MSKIGYILNESAVQVNEIDVVESGDRVTGKGRLQTGNERNRNGRCYRTEDLAREIKAPRQLELLATKNMLGEAGHPLSKELIRQQTIDPKNTCVRYLKFWMQGDDVMGIFQGTNNALGETFDKDLRSGVKPAFSLRALGTISASPSGGAVVENLRIITYDYVIYPSHPGAYTEGIINESASGIMLPSSSFKNSDSMDGTKSSIYTFTNEDVVRSLKQTATRESAIEYIKDKSANFHLLKECFDMTKYDMADFVDAHHIALTEAGNSSIVMNIEDYIANEIQTYASK